MQAIIYRLSFYNTEVFTKGTSGWGPLFLFTRNRKRNTCEARYALQTFPHPSHSPNSSTTLPATCQAGYYNVKKPNRVNGQELWPTMQLKKTTQKHNANRINLPILTIKHPVLYTVHVLAMIIKLKKCYFPTYFLTVGFTMNWGVALTTNTHLRAEVMKGYGYRINILKTKRNLLYIRNQSVLRSEHFPPLL